MEKKVGLVIVIATSVMFSGCATLVGGGGSQTISVTSNKPLKGIMKYSDGKGEQYFTTPTTLNIDRRNKDVVLESQDGQFQKKVVKSKLNPWFLGNIITGGLPGSTTDAVSGAMWKYDDNVAIPAN